VVLCVVLGCTRSDLPSPEDRCTDGLEACAFEVVQETIAQKKESLYQISTGNIEVHVDTPGFARQIAQHYIGPTAADPRAQCVGTLSSTLTEACITLKKHHLDNPLPPKVGDASRRQSSAKVRWGPTQRDAKKKWVSAQRDTMT